MSMHMANVYTPDGRLRGSYVYMLLCQADVPVLIKIGRSCSPLSRLSALRTGCPVEPSVISLAEVASIHKAKLLEHDLHDGLHRWHSHLEWFKVLPTERGEFNAAIKPIVQYHESPSRRIHWRNYSIPAIAKEASRRRAYHQTLFMNRGLAYRDFKNAK